MKQYNKEEVLEFVSKCNSMLDYKIKRNDSLPTLFTLRKLGWMKDCINITRCNREIVSEANRKRREDEFIKEATILHLGKYNYSKVHYIDCKKKVEIICPLHGLFIQSPEVHLRIRNSGYICGCPLCGKEHQIKEETKWTKEKIIEFASQYNCSAEFKKASKESHNGAYTAAQRMGLLNELRKLWKNISKRDYWTEKRCIEFARTCNMASEIQRKNGHVYYLLKDKYKILDKLFPNYRDPNAKIGAVYAYIWEDLQTIYIGSTTTIRLKDRDEEHRRKSDKVYKFSKVNNVDIPKQIILLQNLTMEEMLDYETIILPQKYKNNSYTVISKPIRSVGRRSAGKWNKQTCYDEAKKYSTLQDFIKHSVCAYYKAKDNDWLKSYTWLKNTRSLEYKKSLCKENALKYNTVKEFKIYASNSYLTACKYGWIDSYEWLNRMKKKNGHWSKELCYEEAKKYTTFKAFRLGSRGAYSKAQKKGWMKEYFWLDTSNTKWTKDRCREEALKYNSRGQFWKNNPSAHNRASKKGWLNEFYPNKLS